MDETAHEALNQIECQNCAADLEKREFPGEYIRKYVFAFEGKQVLIKELKRVLPI